MRFMIMVRADATGQATVAFHEQLARAGVLLDVGGYTLIQVRSREEALAWARRFPPPGPDTEIELRPLPEPDQVDRFPALAR